MLQPNFDPEKVAAVEVAWWRAHNDKDQERLMYTLTRWLKELYGIGESEAGEMIKHFATAVGFHDTRQWQKAIGEMALYYEQINITTNSSLDATKLAQLEIGWWLLHDELEFVEDKSSLARQFADLYAHTYGIEPNKLIKAGHYKAVATREHDIAESPETPGNAVDMHWQKAEDYLRKFYQTLLAIK